MIDDSWTILSKMLLYVRGYKNLTYRGVPIRKMPCDLWMIREILDEVRPALVVEFGTFYGGSALWLGDQLELLGNGRVLTIDVDAKGEPPHPRVRYYCGHSLAQDTYDMVCQEVAAAGGPVMFIEDSRHLYEHVLQELWMYADMVSVGSYFIVEDTTRKSVGRAAAKFLRKRPDFEADTSRERLRLTWTPGGWLRRKT